MAATLQGRAGLTGNKWVKKLFSHRLRIRKQQRTSFLCLGLWDVLRAATSQAARLCARPCSLQTPSDHKPGLGPTLTFAQLHKSQSPTVTSANHRTFISKIQTGPGLLHRVCFSQCYGPFHIKSDSVINEMTLNCTQGLTAHIGLLIQCKWAISGLFPLQAWGSYSLLV